MSARFPGIVPWRVLLIVLPMALLAGCASVTIGRDFDLAAFDSKVQRGVTTQTQVRAWLGAPNSTGVAVNDRGERHEEWTYYYAHGRPHGLEEAQLKILQVRFAPQGTVLSYSWSGDTGK